VMRNSLTSSASSAPIGCTSHRIAASNHGSHTSAATVEQLPAQGAVSMKLHAPTSSTIGCAASRDTRVPSEGSLVSPPGVTRVFGRVSMRPPGPRVGRPIRPP
jgi:hypothetical protein